MDTSNRLTVLGADLKAAETRRKHGLIETLEADIEIGRILLEAREKFKDHADFGVWLKDVGSTTPYNERAAYIEMARQPDRFRSILEKTERKSIRMIYEHEFKALYSSKPKPTARPKPPEAEARDSEIIDRHDRGEKVADIGKAAGLGDRRTARIIQDEELVRKGVELGRLEGAPVSATAQEKLDAHKRRMEKDFDLYVREEAAKVCEEYRLKIEETWAKRLGDLERSLKRRGKVFTKAEYNAILQVLHPDTGAHVSETKRATAFRLFNERKVKLLDEKDFSTADSTRDYVAEREAQRAAHQAKQKMAREAKKGASA